MVTASLYCGGARTLSEGKASWVLIKKASIPARNAKKKEVTR
jgi:hypothetical protein